MIRRTSMTTRQLQLLLKPSIVAAATLPLALACAWAQNAAPGATTVEAEANPTAGDIELIEDATASGGKAVSMPRDWQPIFKSALPAQGEAFTIWVRYSGASILLKSLKAGAQSDLKWSYAKPEALRWVKIGRFDRGQIGDSLLIIRAAGKSPLLDAVVFAADDAYTPEEKSGTAPPDGTFPKSNVSIATGAAPGVAPGSVPGAPAGTLVEAESKLPSGDTQVLLEASASGGRAISIPRDWQPLLKAAIPAQGEVFNIWVRARGGSLLVKSSTNGQQKDLKSIARSDALTWTNAGRYTRADLGDTLLVIRSGGGGQGAVLDCVVFAPDENARPGAAQASTSPSSSTSRAEGEVGTAAQAAGINEAAAIALGAVDAPRGTLVEAETNRPAGTNSIVEAPGASGGRAVTSDREWQSLFEAPVPQGEAFKVWIRHRNGPIMLKARVEGKVKDNWIWKRPAQWSWTEAGVWSRADLGEKLVIGRGADRAGEAAPLIDAVVFAPDKVRPLPPFEPDPKAAPETLRPTINWSRAAAKMPAAMWGVNDYEILDPKAAADPRLQSYLAALKPALIHIHFGGLSDRWTDAKTKSWDVAKIKAGFAASTGYVGAPIMLCINEPPTWMHADGPLPREKTDEFAALCADLVRIMRDEVKRPIAYWEITNEQDNRYEKEGKLDDLWMIYNKVALAIKKVDPLAKVGGPALTYAKAAWVEGFLKNCGANADFITWHNYGTGDHFEPNDSLFSKVEGNVSLHARGVAEAVRKHASERGNRKMEMFLTETNVKYTWDPFERRHANNVGAIFQALVNRRMALDGVDGVALWHVKGNAYGMMDADGTLRAPAHLYEWGTKYLSGTMAASTSPDEKSLQVLAITRADGARSILLLNQTNHTITVPRDSALLGAAPKARLLRLDATQTAPKPAPWDGGELSLPGYSLTLLTTATP